MRLINQRAKQIGAEADYNDDWQKLATNGYKAEGENLEARSNTGIIRK